MRLGRHMPTNSRPVKAVETARRIGCDTIQIFASNPTAWRPTAANPAGDAAFAEAARLYNLDPVVLHAPYLINLASPDEAIWEKSLVLLTWTMPRAELLGDREVCQHN